MRFMENKRQSNFEFLRIIAMLMIVSNHLFRHGIINANAINKYILWGEGSVANKIVGSLFLPGGRVGVALFFMITGYFLAFNKKDRSIKKTVLIAIDYGIILSGCMIFFRLTGIHDFSYATIIESLFLPVTDGLGWFIPVYLLISLLSDKINRFVLHINSHGKIIFICMVWALDYTLGNIFSTNYYSIARGLVFYLIGSYLKYFELRISKMRIHLLFLSFILSWFGISYFEYKNGFNLNNYSLINDIIYNAIITSVLVPICAISLFLIVIKLRYSNNELINFIASNTLAVYILHDSVIGRYVFWEMILRTSEVWKYTTNLGKYYVLLAYGIIAPIIVFIICILFEIVRRRLKGIFIKTRIGNRVICYLNKMVVK